jgi:hypothetical protein
MALPHVVLAVYISMALIAGIHRYLLGPTELGGTITTHYNNFLIFKSSFLHLIENRDLYVHYPQEHADLFKYSPSFAIFIAPLALLPNLLGLLLWNLANSLVLYFGIRLLPEGSIRNKTVILYFILLELLTSIQNSQSNGLITGLLVMAFAFLEGRRPIIATLLIALTCFIKPFGIIGFLPVILYPERWKSVLYAAVWMLIIAVLPLVVVSPSQLVSLYDSWLQLLFSDHARSYGFSVMGWLHTWFGLEPYKVSVVLAGIALLCAPLLRFNLYGDYRFRKEVLASVLIWVVIFNHRAESPTFILAVTGVALWYFARPRLQAERVLLWLVFILTCLSPTDLFPPIVRKKIIGPYVLKAVPCIAVWLKLSYELLFGTFRGQRTMRNDAEGAPAVR